MAQRNRLLWAGFAGGEIIVRAAHLKLELDLFLWCLISMNALKLALRICLLASLSIATHAHAITVDGGDYAYMPDRTALGVVYLQHFEGKDMYVKGQKVSDNARLSGDTLILRGVQYRDWWDYGLVPQFLLPMGVVRTGGILDGVQTTNGIGDLILVLPIHFIKDPTGRDAFAISPYLWLPTGHYDKRNGLNPFAENRWKFSLQLGRTLKVSEQISLELVGDVQFHGKNNDFGPGGATMEQKPLWEWQTHVRYFVAPRTYIGGMLALIEGGETRVSGVDQDDSQKRTKALLSVGHFVASDTQLITSIGKDLSIRTGVKEDFRLNFRILKLF